MKRKIQEGPITQWDVRNAIMLATQQSFVIQWDVTIVIGLVTNPKTVENQEVKPWEII